MESEAQVVPLGGMTRLFFVWQPRANRLQSAFLATNSSETSPPASKGRMLSFLRDNFMHSPLRKVARSVSASCGQSGEMCHSEMLETENAWKPISRARNMF